MSFCFFAHFRHPDNVGAPVSAEALDTVHGILRDVGGLSRALIHTPAPADTAHPFPKDEAPPALALQLYAPRLESLEEALRPDGALQPLVHAQNLSVLRASKCQQQVMLVRAFQPPGAQSTQADTTRCSYLVHYPGHADNLNLWLTHYLAHHPQIMCHFPNIREVEICTRVDWIGGLPGMRVNFMQRNKQVFDNPDALSASLLSPVIRTMRQDFHAFPDFAGGNIHYPMLTHEVTLPTNA